MEAEAVARLGVHPVTLRTWRSKGLGPKRIRFGVRGVRYPAEGVERYLREGEPTPRDA
jgi:DNA-binding transcriptional MerR regulator